MSLFANNTETTTQTTKTTKTTTQTTKTTTTKDSLKHRPLIAAPWDQALLGLTLPKDTMANPEFIVSGRETSSNIFRFTPGLEQEKKLLRTLSVQCRPALISTTTRAPYQINRKYLNLNNHLFVPFNDITIHTTSLDLLRLSSGLTKKNTSAFLRLNVNAHGRRSEDLIWGRDSKRMLSLPNAGGASMLSEVLSYEVMERILGIKLLKTEMEVKYLFINQPMTDYLVNMQHPHYATWVTVGVSVTRAYAHDRRYTKEDAFRLLKKKLAGVNSSTRNINNARVWKQILHIWCPNGATANVVKRVYMRMSQELKSNTVIVVSVIKSKWVFNNNKVFYPPRKKDLPKRPRKKGFR
ncbi:hypothetical protein G9A89_018483 [Geosiphon pyriformis]|nr:hypothetical protein G9A89_018483 [Geosiphon pyriformis]